MNFLTFISRLFKGKEKANSDTYVPLNGSPSGVNSQNLLTNNKNWVFVAVDRIASACSGVRYKVMKYTKSGDDIEIFNGPLVDFLSKPHPQLTWRDFVYLNSAYKELAGNAFWEIEEKRVFSPLLPTKIRPIVDHGELIGYKYQDGVRTVVLPLDKVLHDRFPSPDNPFWGSGPLERIAGWVDTDEYASEFNRLFFINGAAFGGFIETDEESKERIELIKLGMKQNHAGVKNAHKVAVLPKNSKFKEATQTMRDMQFSELDTIYRDKILAAFGVPKTLAGLVTEVNRASAEASEYIFSAYTIKPKVDRFVDFLNNFVVPLFDKSGQYYIAYDDFIPENNEVKIREYESALNRNQYMTVNEVRSVKGLPPVTGGDSIYGNPFQLPLGEVQEQPEEDDLDDDKSLSSRIANKAVEFVDKSLDKDLLAHKTFVSRTSDYQKKVAQKIKDFNLHQKNEVLRKLGQITKAVSRGDLFDMKKEVGVMMDLVTPLLVGLLTEQALKEYADQGFEGQLNLADINITKIIERAASRMAKSYNQTTADLVKDALNEGIREGEGIDLLAKRVGQVYEFSDSYRASMVAHTETFYVANEANREAYRQSGVVTSVRWYTADDPCQYCGPMSGKVVGIEEVFFKKGDTYEGAAGGKLTFDYRTIDVPPLHPNCECFIRPDEIVIKSMDSDDLLIQELEAILK